MVEYQWQNISVYNPALLTCRLLQAVAPDWRVGTFAPGVHRWSDHAMASTPSSLY